MPCAQKLTIRHDTTRHTKHKGCASSFLADYTYRTIAEHANVAFTNLKAGGLPASIDGTCPILPTSCQRQLGRHMDSNNSRASLIAQQTK